MKYSPFSSLLLALPCLFYFGELQAQCPNTNVFYTSLNIPNAGDADFNTCAFGGEYLTIDVSTGNTYVFSTCAGSGFDTELTLYNDATGTFLAYNDDAAGCGFLSEITWTATFTGTVRLLINEFSCQSNNSCMRIDAENLGGATVGPANDDCAGAIAITHGGVGNCTYSPGSVAGATQSLPGCTGTADNDVWFRFTATASQAEINVQGSTGIDAVFEVFDACGGTSLACVDGTGTGGLETTTLTGLVIGATYSVRVYHWFSSAPSNPNFEICVTTPGTVAPPGTNVSCASLDPICTNSGLNFQANAAGTIEPGYASDCGQTPVAGNDYGCLCLQPDPSWYYLEIDNPGDIEFEITGSLDDVDFALWGPYTNLAAAQADCGALPVPADCSYSIASTELVTIPAAQTGDVYILLITNYANIVQNITATQIGGAGSTNCSIVTPCDADAGSW